MAWLQNRSSAYDQGCPSAMCTYEHPYARTWCLLWTNCDKHKSPMIGHHSGSNPAGRSSKSLPATSALKSSNRTIEFLGCSTLQEPMRLWAVIWPIGTNDSQDPKAQGSNALVHWENPPKYRQWTGGIQVYPPLPGACHWGHLQSGTASLFVFLSLKNKQRI